MAQKTNNLSLVSLGAGVASWMIAPFIASIVAVITGHMARKEIRDAQGAEEGDTFAVAGLVLGYANLLASVAAFVFVMLVLMGIVGAGIFAAILS